MSEDFDGLEDMLSSLMEIEVGFDSKTWKNKEMITKTAYMRETLKVCREYFNEFKNNYAPLNKYATHNEFETYCMKNEKSFDKLLKNNRGTDIEDYLYSIDARIGIKMDKEDSLQTVFFRIKEDEVFIYYALPKTLYDKYDKSFKAEEAKMKENEGMYI
jgi:hypothetical protein